MARIRVDCSTPVVVRPADPSPVPKPDPDGNTIAGVWLPAVAVPTATSTGWNLRADDDGDGCDAAGMMIPFARTEAERRAAGDPRPALEARHAGPAAAALRRRAAWQRETTLTHSRHRRGRRWAGRPPCGTI